MGNRELILDVWLQWECRECGRRKDTEDGEEWTICCEHTMRLQLVKKLTVKEE